MKEILHMVVSHLTDFRRAGVTQLEVSEGAVKLSFRGDGVPVIVPSEVDGSRLHRPASKPEPVPDLPGDDFSLATAHVD